MGADSYNTNPDLNTSQLGMATGNNALNVGSVDNAIRKLMADIATFYQAWSPLIAQITSKQGASAILNALVGAGAASARVPYYTGSDSAALTPISPLGASLLGIADATAACNALGAVRVAALSLADPGYVKFQVGSAPLYFTVQWGANTCNVGNTVITYPVAFSTFSRPVISGGSTGVSQINGPYVVSTTASNFTAHADVAATGFWIAVGV